MRPFWSVVGVAHHYRFSLKIREGVVLWAHMKSIIQFDISHDNGVYTASAVNAPIVTEGATFEALQDNIRDAVALYFEGDDPALLGFERRPAILTSFEVTAPMHAGRA